jgi:hypothetical protein
MGGSGEKINTEGTKGKQGGHGSGAPRERKEEFTTEGTEDTESEGGCRERCREGPCTYSILGGGALGVELHYLLDDFLYVGDAAEGHLNR